MRPIENPCPDWQNQRIHRISRRPEIRDRPSQRWNCIIKLVSSWYRGACSCQFGAILQSWFHFFCPSFHLIIRSVSWIMLSFPPASAAHCKAQLSIFAQVDNVGNAWVAGLHVGAPWMGTPMRAVWDIFLMKFDAQGCPPVDSPAWWWELWRCSGSEGGRGATLFFLRYLVTFSTEQRLQNSLGGRCSESRGVASPLKWINLLCAFIRFDISYLVKCLMEVWAMNFD